MLPNSVCETTNDTLFGGRVALTQPAKKCGYRVNVDALLLAAFARSARTAKFALDLGAGAGAVGLSLLHLGAAHHVTMIEIDPELARLARANAHANGWADRVTVLTCDVEEYASDRAHGITADLVVCNPPYVPPGRGREPLGPVARAKMGALDAFVCAARVLAGQRARVCFVYPAVEAASLFESVRQRGLEPKRLRIVHAKPLENARIVLVECVPGRRGGLVVEPPLVETDGHGKRSPELDALCGC
ncbi:MAG: methyltransferase [Polyangiaceae bacterium]|nr:methyltransferase [Polyangiaceae bacterium]